MSAANDRGALNDLRDVVRIAKAASIGVTGNAPRIAKAEAAIDAVVALYDEALKAAAFLNGIGRYDCAQPVRDAAHRILSPLQNRAPAGGAQ